MVLSGICRGEYLLRSSECTRLTMVVPPNRDRGKHARRTKPRHAPKLFKAGVQASAWCKATQPRVDRRTERNSSGRHGKHRNLLRCGSAVRSGELSCVRGKVRSSILVMWEVVGERHLFKI